MPIGRDERLGLPDMRMGITVVMAVVAGAGVGQTTRLALQATSGSANDLAVSGDVAGIPAGATRYAKYAELSALPQVTVTVKGDDNFSEPVKVSGVSLDKLAAAVGAEAGKKQLVAAICSDGYEGHFTAEYRAAHHPVLALRVNEKGPAGWQHGPDGENLGPYLVAQAAFQPTGHVLAQAEVEQDPYAVTELKFYDEDAVTAALKPKKATPAAMEGYRIAMENCLRCHRAEGIGGTKSPFEWPQLAMIAQGNPGAFGKYVKEPMRVNPEATMPGNPEFDAATIAAVTAYFQGQM